MTVSNDVVVRNAIRTWAEQILRRANGGFALPVPVGFEQWFLDGLQPGDKSFLRSAIEQGAEPGAVAIGEFTDAMGGYSRGDRQGALGSVRSFVVAFPSM